MILGIGTDNTLLMRKNLQSPWEKLASKAPALAATTVLRNGVILGVGKDTALWKQELSGTYSQVPNSTSVKGAAVMPNGTIIGVGTDNQLWTRPTLNSPWTLVPGSGSVMSVAVMPDGKIVAVGTDSQLWTRATLTSPWAQVPNSGAVKSITVLPNGTLVGVGMDNALWTRATLTSQWVQVPNSGPVVSVGSYPVECDPNSTTPQPPVKPELKPVLELLDGNNKVPPNAHFELGTVPECTTGAPKSFTIKNAGTGNLKVSRIELSAPGDFLLSVPPPLPRDLAPGASMSFELRFSPKSAGRKATAVNILSDDTSRPTYSFTVGGTAEAKPKLPKFVIKQYYSYTNIYEVPISHCGDYTFREFRPSDPFTAMAYYVENHGEGELRIQGASLSDTRNFVLVQDTGTPNGRRPTFPMTIRPGGREIFYLVFRAQGPRPYWTTVQFNLAPPVETPVFSFTMRIP